MPSSLTLSLLRLPRADARWRHLDAYGAHRLAWSGFPGLPEIERPFLFSHDTRGGAAGGVQSLLVQSTVAPDWAALGPAADVRTKTVDAAALAAGARVGFALRANPTVARDGFGDGKRRRIGVGTNPELAFQRMGRPWPARADEVETWRRESLAGWLARAGARGGFAVEAAEAGPAVARQVVRTQGGRPDGRPMTLHEVEFSGVLRVTDAAAFAETRAAGLGRGRSFGFGLLLLRPA